MTEFESTINNGLPVRVRGTVHKCHRREYPGSNYCDDLEVLWMSGKPCNLNLTPMRTMSGWPMNFSRRLRRAAVRLLKGEPVMASD